MTGSVGVAGDIDFFELDSINSLWGFIAVLDTSASTTGKDAILSAYDSDGTTLLQQDQGGWGKGSVLAWQHFQTGSGSGTPIYIKVEASNAGSAISEYTLRIYIVSIGQREETEPNDTPGTGNISSNSHLGKIDDNTDADCYRLSGNDNHELILALRADPENDGSTTDFVLSLYDASGSLLASADHSGSGGNEYIDAFAISRAIYSYCVTAKTGAGSTASYKAGALINGDAYLPTGNLEAEWLNPGLGGVATIGDILEFRASVTNTTLLPIPAEIHVGVYNLPACLAFEDTSDFDSVGSTEAYKVFVVELATGVSYQVDFSAKALSGCSDVLLEYVLFSYHDFSGGGRGAAFSVATNQCEAITLQIAGPTYSGDGATYYSSETGIETAPDPLSKITIEFPHKLILEAPSIVVKDGDEFVVESGAQLRAYGKAVTCP